MSVLKRERQKVGLVTAMTGAVFSLIAVTTVTLSAEPEPPDAAMALLPKHTRAKVEKLARRLEKQQRETWSLPDSAKLINAREELAEICTAADLVVIPQIPGRRRSHDPCKSYHLCYILLIN